MKAPNKVLGFTKFILNKILQREIFYFKKFIIKTKHQKFYIKNSFNLCLV